MRIAAVAVAVLMLAAVGGATQGTPQFVIDVRVFAANPQDPASQTILTATTFRTAGARVATLDLGAQADGLHVDVTPSDLGAGKVGLKVVIETRHAGRAMVSTFDLLTGAETSPATIALRDAAGSFMLDDKGRPLFATFATTTRR